MNHEIGFLLGFALVLYFSQIFGFSGLRQSVRRLERKLDAIIKHQGVEWPSAISPEVRLLAQDPRKKIAAIKLHRDQNPNLGLSEAKKDIEDCVSVK